MKKNKISGYLIFISFFTVAAVFVLIIQKSYSNLISPTKQVQIEDTGKGINPILDTSVIGEIKTKDHINPSDLPENDFALPNAIINVPTPVIASPSAEPVGPKVVIPTVPVPTLIP